LPVEAITGLAPAESANTSPVAKEMPQVASTPAVQTTLSAPVSEAPAARAATPAPSVAAAEPVAADAKVPSENTWTGEQVVLALEDPLFVASTSPMVPAVANDEPKQESLFDLELMPEEPSKTAHA